MKKNPPSTVQFVDVNGGPALFASHADGSMTLIVVEGHDGQITEINVVRNPDKLAFVLRRLIEDANGPAAALAYAGRTGQNP